MQDCCDVSIMRTLLSEKRCQWGGSVELGSTSRGMELSEMIGLSVFLRIRSTVKFTTNLHCNPFVEILRESPVEDATDATCQHIRNMYKFILHLTTTTSFNYYIRPETGVLQL